LEKDVITNLAQKMDSESQPKEYNLKDVEPYNESDMYKRHCDMLVSFGEQSDSFTKPKDVEKG